MIFITDWFATFLKLAGVDTKSLPPTDSKNVWRRLIRNKKSRRKEIVLNLDTEPQEGLWSAAIRSGDLKLIWGQDKLLKQKVRLEILIATVMTLSLLADAGVRQQC